ncbi:MAG: hypothetical protein NZV14_01400 [Bryobacteraceae bacterium]|nr:hypothetical protein [Bryobacteraceae bacterium]MDW8376785.1 hypothetical protein [Bryobacterales bacterium]
MHTRRLVTLILGLWLGLTGAMFFVATQNFRGVDRLLAEPAREASKSFELLGRDSARMLLRYQVSELNRFYFDWFSMAQIAFAVLLALVLLFATNGNKLMLFLSLSLVLVAIFEKFMLVPEITFLGRAIDFVPAEVSTPARSRFWSFHSAYSVAEVIKLGLLLAIALKMLVASYPKRSRSTRLEQVGTPTFQS